MTYENFCPRFDVVHRKIYTRSSKRTDLNGDKFFVRRTAIFHLDKLKIDSEGR